MFATSDFENPLKGTWSRAKLDHEDGKFWIGVPKGDIIKEVLWEDVAAWDFALTKAKTLPPEVTNDPGVVRLANSSYESLA